MDVKKRVPSTEMFASTPSTVSHQLDQQYASLLVEFQDDLNVIGFVLGGSRGKGFESDTSDYDCTLIVKDGLETHYRTKYSDLPEGIDLEIYTLSGLQTAFRWGGRLEWGRYNWAYLTPQIDRTQGELQQIVQELGRVPAEVVDQVISENLDYLANQFYRSLKCLRRGDRVGYRLEAAEIVKPLFIALFALHGRRLRPYYKYLIWELENDPLDKLPWDKDALLKMVFSILETGDYRAQQQLVKGVETLFRSEGYHDVFDSWGNQWIELLDWSHPKNTVIS